MELEEPLSFAGGAAGGDGACRCGWRRRRGGGEPIPGTQPDMMVRTNAVEGAQVTEDIKQPSLALLHPRHGFLFYAVLDIVCLAYLVST